MLTQVGTLLDGVTGTSVLLQTAKGAGRHYELLIIAEIADELHRRGYDIDLVSSDGTRQKSASAPCRYRQRGGKPVPFPPASKGPNGPTSVLFRHPAKGQEWEIWNGVEFQGRSGGHHEFDVAVVPKDLADAVRLTGGAPLGHGWISIECKNVADAGSPDEVRALIARIYDTTLTDGQHRYFRPRLTPARIYPPDATAAGFGPTFSTYRKRNEAGYAALVRTTGISSGAGALADGYFIEKHGTVTLGSPALAAFRKDIADWIDTYL